MNKIKFFCKEGSGSVLVTTDPDADPGGPKASGSGTLLASI